MRIRDLDFRDDFDVHNITAILVNDLLSKLFKNRVIRATQHFITPRKLNYLYK